MDDCERSRALAESYEELLLDVLAAEREWRLDDRIAYAVDHRRA
jgi:hypothetical protein